VTDTNPILSLDEEGFGQRIHTVLFPSGPIESREFLFGRDADLDRIRRALMAPARQIFIYGERGVGKSSLANAAAAQCQSSDAHPIHVSGSSTATFSTIVGELLRATNMEPSGSVTKKRSGQVKVSVLEVGGHNEVTTPAATPPLDINEAAARLDAAFKAYSTQTVAVIDEFDGIPDLAERNKFAELLKALGDKRSSAKLIFTGVATSLDELLQSHGSAQRQIEPIELGRIDYHPRLEIIKKALEAFDLYADDSVIYRIASVSNGFPYYVHLLTEHLLWKWFEGERTQEVTMEHLHEAFRGATNAVHVDLRRPYDKAVKGREHAEYALWATADAYDLDRHSDVIWQSYRQICDTLDVEPYEKPKFLAQLRKLKDPSHESILESVPNRRLYKFREAMVRGYVRMAAACKNIDLDDQNFDYPPQVRVHTPRNAPRKRWIDPGRYIPPVSMGKPYKGR